MKTLLLTTALAIGLVGNVHALTFTETIDLPNIGTSNTPFVLGPLSQGSNVIYGQISGVCETGSFSGTDCQSGIDPQDAFQVDVLAGDEIFGIAIALSSALGPPDWKIRISVVLVAPGGHGFTFTNAFHLDLPRTGITLLPGMPLSTGRYDISVFSFGDPAIGVSGTFDTNWAIDVGVRAAVPVPPAAAMLAGAIGVAVVAARRRSQTA